MTVVIAWALVHVLWQGTLVAALYWSLQCIVRSPRTRHLVGMGLLLCCSLLFGASIHRILVPPAGLSTHSFGAAERPLSGPTAVMDRPLGILVGEVVGSAAPAIEAAGLVVVATWIVGTLLLLARLIVEARRAWRVCAEAERAPRDLMCGMNLEQIRLRESDIVTIPMVVGFVKPTIVIPGSLRTRIPAPALRAVVAHEVAHVTRRDPIVNLAQVVIETIFWFNWPLLWLSRRVRLEREVSCDERASREIGRIDYIRVLLRLDQNRGQVTRLIATATSGDLVERARRLIGSHRAAPRLASVVAAVSMQAGLACMLYVGQVWTTWQSSVAIRSPDSGVMWIHAEDPAGRFELTLVRGVVRNVEVDGTAARIAQRGSAVVVTPDAGPVFMLRLEPAGGFHWEARPPRVK